MYFLSDLCNSKFSSCVLKHQFLCLFSVEKSARKTTSSIAIVLPIIIAAIILAISIVIVAIVIMLRKRRKQRVSEDTLVVYESPDHVYDMIQFAKGASLTTEHEQSKEAEIKMNMQAVQYENIAYGYSLQKSTDVLPNEAIYAEVDTF